MHLLNATTKQLEYFDEPIPPYAILSHTWGKEEVLFNHIAGSDDARCEGERRKGYVKIVGACKQAIEDGWKYIWIDSCCINKESSAELSEAINSMYEWYQKAEICYVYLEDVYSSVHNQRSIAGEIGMYGSGEEDNPVKMVPFERSRWFSRGWTLQELLAPQYVVFYSRDWVDIGTRASLQDVISATTRIRVEMLVAFDPKEASVAERMSWAACRKTTRKEDIAYCLMGLFGVNMPLLYGEGDKAFRRLQEEIMKGSNDHSLFAWKGEYSDYTAAADAYLFFSNYKARGLLAESPWDFRDGADMVPSDDGAFFPYSMTNQGLQIQLPLQPINLERDLLDIDPDYRKNIFRATLKCTTRDKQPTQWTLIYLKMIKTGHYERVFAHLLHETETDPNETGSTSLLVPQIDTSTTYKFPKSQYIRMKTLPTESGFTIEGHSLVEGYEHPDHDYIAYEFIKVTIFDGPAGECFAMVIGSKNCLFWLDVVDVSNEWSHPQKREELKDGIKQAYKEGRHQYNMVLRHLDRLSVRTSDCKWSVVVSAKKSNNNYKGNPYLCVTVDIQRVPILSRGWYTPSPTSTGDSFDGYLTSYLSGHYVVHPNFKKECSDWIAIFNPKTEKAVDVSPVHSITYHPLPDNEDLSIFFVQFSPDGKYLVVKYSGHIIRVYDTNTGEPCAFFDGKDIFYNATSACFSPDGKFLAIGAVSETIALWDIEKSDICKVLGDIQHPYGLSKTSLCFSLDMRLIVSGSDHGTIRIWNIANETSCTFTIDDKESFVQSVAISPNGRLVAGGCTVCVGSPGSDAVYIWDILTTHLVKKLERCHSIIFTPDGERLVIGGSHGLGTLDVGELVPSQLKVTRGIEDSDGAGPDDDPRISGMLAQGEARLRIISKSDVRSLAVSCDGHWAISGSDDASVQFWNLKEGTAQFMLQEHMGIIYSVDMSPAGNVFVTSSLNSSRIRICVSAE